MSSPANDLPGKKKHVPYVPETMEMKEFTLRAILLGLLMTIVLGAANAYLGLRAGITIAATYPAAVIAMAAMRAWKGSLLEENIARTAGSIGESVAAGAIFTIPAFLIAKAWPTFGPGDAYWKSTALIMVGSILGVLFISLVRRGMVEDPELPFPESLAASEIHKAGQRGAEAAKYLFWNIGVGGFVYLLGRFGLFAADKDLQFGVGSLGRSQVRLGAVGSTNVLAAGGASMVAAPSVSPAYLGVGYIIGLRLAALQFSGGVLAWGLMVPLLMYFLGPQLKQYIPADTPDDWATMAAAVWRLYRAAHRGRRHAGRRSVHALQHARQPDCRAGQGVLRSSSDRRAAGQTLAHRALHEFEGCLRADRAHVCGDVLSLRAHFRAGVAGDPGGSRHAGRGIYLRHGVREPGGIYRFLEQSNLRSHALDADYRCAADGGSGRSRNFRRGDGAWSCRRGLRLSGSSRRVVARLQSRLHPRRHAQQDSECGIDRGCGGESSDVLAALPAAHSVRLWKPRTLRRRKPG